MYPKAPTFIMVNIVGMILIIEFNCIIIKYVIILAFNL